MRPSIIIAASTLLLGFALAAFWFVTEGFICKTIRLPSKSSPIFASLEQAPYAFYFAVFMYLLIGIVLLLLVCVNITELLKRVKNAKKA
jgi:hypothetical protein